MSARFSLLRTLKNKADSDSETIRHARLLEISVLRKSTELRPGPLSDTARNRLATALTLASALTKEPETAPQAEGQLALIQLRLSHDRLMHDKYNEAAALAKSAIAIYEKRLASSKDRTWSVELLAGALGRLGRVQTHQGELDDATSQHTTARYVFD